MINWSCQVFCLESRKSRTIGDSQDSSCCSSRDTSGPFFSSCSCRDNETPLVDDLTDRTTTVTCSRELRFVCSTSHSTKCGRRSVFKLTLHRGPDTCLCNAYLLYDVKMIETGLGHHRLWRKSRNRLRDRGSRVIDYFICQGPIVPARHLSVIGG